MTKTGHINLPVGYYKFHKNAFFNYQLNRWYSLGYSRKEDLETIGARIRSFDDYVHAFSIASDEALQENRLKHAATYCRASEFLIAPGDDRKRTTYDRFIALFDRAFADEPFERHAVPYQEGRLSVIRIPALTDKKEGTIVACGGFDSFLEEFFCIWKFFAENGFDVIAFEGPGQGGTLRKYHLTFDHDWEKPAAAVLDYFKIDDATAIGVSMGGYWIMRTAAFEKRIKRVVAFPPVYDWMEMTNAFNRKLATWMMKYRGMMNFFVRQKMKIGILKHTVDHALFIQGKTEPFEAVEWMMGMNKNHLSSHLIDQDVLLLAGENDAFQPPVLLHRQKEALIHARSVTVRIFKRSEHADQHCQIGNVGLALETILAWIQSKNN